MASGQVGLILQQLRRLFGGPPADDLGDGPLLERFQRQRDQAAFTALVQRHGPLVLAVCRRVLRQEQDAEDAFQATFLVLARKAGSIRRPEALGAYLYEVAYRIALKARARAARQRMYERQAADMPGNDQGREEFRRELRGVLDEELHRLPERYRRLLVLCDLQGRTHQEAARQLGLPPGSLSRHLGRARELLRERLVQRGVTLSGALLTAVLLEEGSAPVSAGLLVPTVRAALAFTAGRAAARSVPPAVATLAEGALHTMSLTRWRVALSVLVVAGVVATAAGVAARHAAGPRSAEPPRDLPIPPSANAYQSSKTDAHGDWLPRGALARLGTVRFRLGGWGEAVLFTPNGRQLVAADGGMGASVWDADTGRPLRMLSRQDLHRAASIALTPDGRTAAVGTGTGVIHLFDFLTGLSVKRLSEQREAVISLAFSPDGKLLAAGSDFDYPRRHGEDNPILLWDADTGKERRRFSGHKDTVHCVAFAPDGKTLASGGGRYDTTLRLWDVATGTQVCQGTGHGGELWSLAFSPDGQTIATASMDKTIRLWDPATGKEKARLTGHREDVMAVAFSPDGKFLASGSFDRTLRLWDPAAGKQLWQVEGDQTGSDSSGPRRLTGGFPALAFSPDGKTLATACRDHTLRLFGVAGGSEVQPIGDQFCAVDAVAFSPDRNRVWTVGGDRNLRLWESATGKEVRALQTSVAEPACVAFSADGRLAATGGEKDKTAHVWDLATGKELQHLATPDMVGTVAFSPDGRTLATANRWQRAEVSLWDVGTGKLLHRLPAPAEQGNYVVSLAFTPDGRTLAAATADGIVQFWDPATGVESWPRLKHFEHCHRLVFADDGRTFAVGNRNGLLAVYESATGKERLRCRGWPFCFSPDGRLLGAGEGTLVSVWDLATGEQVGRFVGHHGDVAALAFSADGSRLVSGSEDTTALVWEMSALGPQLRLLAEPTPAQLELLWLELAGGDAAAASRAIGTLTAAPGQAVPFLAGKLRPVSPADAKEVARLVTDLDSDPFEVRRRAGTELERLGETAEPGLRRALAGELGPDAQRRVERLLDRLQAWPPERLRTVRSLEALERIGTPEARDVVARLARESTGTRTGTAAGEVLRRLERRATPASPER
jgi:RNA polymerase sigma factor (sigma-70 family)